MGGNSKTCLIATIGPSLFNYDESYSTLMFATRAMSVKNHAIINEVVDFKTLSGNLQRKISMIESEKYRLMARNVDLEREIAVLHNQLKVYHNSGVLPNQNATPAAVANNNMQQQQQQGSSSLSNLDTKKWEERERDLINKFTNIIHHLQMEIAKQNIVQSSLASQSSSDGDVVLEQLIDSFLAIPAVRQRVITKLSAELPFKELLFSSMNKDNK